MGAHSGVQVSVGILCFNGRPYLDACLAAVLDQDYPRHLYHVVLVDNGSTDGSADFVEQHYPQVQVVRLDRNYGCDEGSNQMVKHIRTRYMAFVNPDCILHRRWLTEMVSAMKGDPQARLAHSNTIFPWWPEWDAQEREEAAQRAYVCDMTLLGIHDYEIVSVTPDSKPIPTLGAHMGASMIDLSVIDQLGYFADPDFFCYADDLDVALRINALGYRVLFLPKAVAYHHTNWDIELSRWGIRKAMLSTRNTILAFYKLSYLSEFLVMLPLLLLGNIQKARQHALGPLRRWLYTLAAIPQTAIGLAEALVNLPAYYDKRQDMLQRRVTEKWWVFHRVRRRQWRPDSRVWAPEDQGMTHRSLAYQASDHPNLAQNGGGHPAAARVGRARKR